MTIQPFYKTPFNLCHTNQSHIINTQNINIFFEHPNIFLCLSWILFLFGVIQIILELFWTKWPTPKEISHFDFLMGIGLEELVLNNPENGSQEEIATNNPENQGRVTNNPKTICAKK